MRICFIFAIFGWVGASVEDSNCSQFPEFESRIYYLPLLETLIDLEHVLRKADKRLLPSGSDSLDSLVEGIGSRILKHGASDYKALLVFVDRSKGLIWRLQDIIKKRSLFGVFSSG